LYSDMVVQILTMDMNIKAEIIFLLLGRLMQIVLEVGKSSII